MIVSGITSIQTLPAHASAFGVLRSMWLSQAKSLAHKLGPQNIHVNTISLGGVLTDYMKAKIEKKARDSNRSYEQQYAESIQNVPLKKYATTQEVSGVIDFLLSENSNHLTGVNIPCEGGFIQGY